MPQSHRPRDRQPLVAMQMSIPQIVLFWLLKAADCCWVKPVEKGTLPQKPPRECFGLKHITAVTHSLHGRCWLGCKHLATTSSAVVKLETLQSRPEMKSVCLQIKRCLTTETSEFKRHSSYFEDKHCSFPEAFDRVKRIRCCAFCNLT